MNIDHIFVYVGELSPKRDMLLYVRAVSPRLYSRRRVDGCKAYKKIEVHAIRGFRLLSFNRKR